MNLSQLRYLVAIVDAGSFSAGAQRAFVTQPTLSQSMKALEEELGQKLLKRTKSGVEATSEGRRVLAHARSILKEAEALKTGKSQDWKRFRIGCAPNVPGGVLSRVVRAMPDNAKANGFRIEEAPPDILRRKLADDRFDAIISIGDEGAKGVSRVVLQTDTLALAFRASQVPSGKVTPRILHREPLIIRQNCEYLQSASRILDDWKVQPRVVALVNSDQNAVALTLLGVGACLMPDSLQQPGLGFVYPEGVQITREVALSWKTGTESDWPVALQDALLGLRAG